VSEDKIEMNLGLVSRGAAVVVIDDVLATGHTLLAVLRLLGEVGIPAEDISVMVVAEFPIHRGREQLYKNGFGRVHIQSLLVFDGM
jgi:adenine/guanine phosphoribosyltransferase-like PRPP-binding protein